jgi:hypothetical protein
MYHDGAKRVLTYQPGSLECEPDRLLDLVPRVPHDVMRAAAVLGHPAATMTAGKRGGVSAPGSHCTPEISFTATADYNLYL